MIDLRRHLHPSTETLVGFAVDEAQLSAGRIESIRGHLLHCAACRGVVARARTVVAVAPELPAPDADLGSMWSTIRDRSSAGDRVLLPLTTPTRRPERRDRVLVAACAAVVVALVWMAVPGMGQLEAGQGFGVLEVDTMMAQPGRAVAVRYSPSAFLSRDDSVVLVATIFGEQPRTRPYDVRTVLRRQDGRDHAGRLALPRDALVARVRLMSADGSRTDDNDGRPWELVVRDSTGHPRFDALVTQFRIRDQEEWEAAHRVVEQMVRYHPDEPMGWRHHASRSLHLAGSHGRDSVLRQFRPEFVRLHEHLASRPVPSDISWEMAMFASEMRDTTRSRFWRERLQREHPSSPAATQFRVWDVTESVRDPAKRLERFDAMYEEVGSGSLQLLFDAYNLALKLGDSASVARWGGHMERDQPETAMWVAAEFVKVPELREQGLRKLRALLRELPPVTSTDWVAGFQRGPVTETAHRKVQTMLTQVANGLAIRGDHRAALDTLRRAGALGRNQRVATQLVRAALAAGDTAAAAHALAWMAADPRTPPATLDSIRPALRTWMARPEFGRWRSDAEAALRQEVLGTSVRRALGTPAPEVLLQGADGKSLTLDSVMGDELTVVAFISRHCAPSLDDLEALSSTAARLGAQGIPVVAVVAEAPSAAGTATYERRGWTGPLHYDTHGLARRAFRQNGTPAYFVVTRDGTVRFTARQSTELLLQAAALAGR